MAHRLERAQPRRKSAQRPQLRVVAGEGKRLRSRVIVVVLAVMTVFGVAAIQAIVGQDGLKAAKLERSVADAQERNTLLQAQVAQMSNPSRVADEATKIGLVGAPDPVHIKVATDDPSVLHPAVRPSGP